MALLFAILSIIAAIAVYTCFHISKNYFKARRIGLPILITPFSLFNPVWALGLDYINPVFFWLATHLPYPFYHAFDFAHYAILGVWNLKARDSIHALPSALQYPAFAIVSPGEVQVIINDPKAADDILSRVRKDFLKSKEMYGPLELFGRNVDTLNGEEWARHRRITAPPFNERNSGLVWEESLRQASAMLKLWVAEGAKGVTNTSSSTLALALHVLTGAGFGKKYDFDAAPMEGVTAGHEMSYRNALKTVLHNMFGTIITTELGAKLPSFLTPKFMKTIQSATTEFRSYMVEMIEEEKQMIGSRLADKDNLMSAMLRASETEKGGKGRNALSDDEIMGNLFIYSFAGHDTTANTLVYAIMLLAANPEWQEWIGEEISAVFAGKDALEDWEYENAFPRLKRCLALQYESLRLWGPVTILPKHTQDSSQQLNISTKTYTIPEQTYVIINVAGIHSNPSVWGPDATEFRPDRFINEGEITQPPDGSFVPWASGQRVCPGKKFAQVEFVAVIAKLFSKHRVRPKLQTGETKEMAFERVKRCVADSEQVIVIKMRHPERVELVWKEKF